MGERSNSPSAEMVAPSFDGSEAWRRIVTPVGGFIHAAVERLAAQVQHFEPEIREYITYALDAQGKHLRPVLVALSGMATGAVNDGHVSAAAIVEMVHLATLVHDDVMDDAQIRRARPTLSARWGGHLAVLVGDCLFAHALKMASQFPTPEVCRIVSTSTNTVCSGEILQGRHAGNFSLSRDDYFRVIRMKTGELFSLSADLGGLLSDAPAPVRLALRNYGMALGTAYQVYDDCLDLFGVEDDAGKTLGSDLAKGKATLPVLLVLGELSAPEQSRWKERLESWEPHDLREFRELLDRHQALSKATATVQTLLTEARAALSPLPATESKTSLLNLTDFLSSQMAALVDPTKVSVQ